MIVFAFYFEAITTSKVIARVFLLVTSCCRLVSLVVRLHSLELTWLLSVLELTWLLPILELTWLLSVLEL